MFNKSRAALCALIGIQLLAAKAMAAIPHALRSTLAREYYFKPILRDFSKGFDIGIIQPVESSRELRGEDIAKIIPYEDMHATANGSVVAAQILDRSLSTWFNSDAVKHSDMGRTAHRVEKSMESDVSFGGSQPESVKHSFKFLMRASQTRANIEYSGITHAQVSYYILHEKTDFELREPMKSLQTQLVYNHVFTRAETREVVSFRWDW